MINILLFQMSTIWGAYQLHFEKATYFLLKQEPDIHYIKA